jgi:hypothetical protein
MLPRARVVEPWATAPAGRPQLAALVVAIATINAYNRLNVATRRITGEWVDRIARTAVHAA